jgi:hypothetical protein
MNSRGPIEVRLPWRTLFVIVVGLKAPWTSTFAVGVASRRVPVTAQPLPLGSVVSVCQRCTMTSRSLPCGSTLMRMSPSRRHGTFFAWPLSQKEPSRFRSKVRAVVPVSLWRAKAR